MQATYCPVDGYLLTGSDGDAQTQGDVDSGAGVVNNMLAKSP